MVLNSFVSTTKWWGTCMYPWRDWSWITWLLAYYLQFGCELQSLEGDAEEQTRMLAAKMGGVTVLRKGEVDVISNGLHGVPLRSRHSILIFDKSVYTILWLCPVPPPPNTSDPLRGRRMQEEMWWTGRCSVRNDWSVFFLGRSERATVRSYHLSFIL